MGRYQDASFAGHSTASQLPEPIFPLNLIKIILPLRMMIQLESWYRVTESYDCCLNAVVRFPFQPKVMPSGTGIANRCACMISPLLMPPLMVMEPSVFQMPETP